MEAGSLKRRRRWRRMRTEPHFIPFEITIETKALGPSPVPHRDPLMNAQEFKPLPGSATLRSQPPPLKDGSMNRKSFESTTWTLKFQATGPKNAVLSREQYVEERDSRSFLAGV